jgi:hypothetical protein
MATRLGKPGLCVSARSMAKPVPILGIALCGSWILVACGGGANSPTPPTLQSISVSPQNGTVAAGITQQFSATGHYSDGSSNTMSSVTWATSNASVAAINSTGLLTAVKQGAVTISATSEGITGNTAVTIGPPNLLSISVSPQNPTVSASGTQQFTATGTYSDGSTQTLNGATWSSGTATVATISSSGLATGLTAGTTIIQATSGNTSGLTTLTVTAASQALSYIAGPTLTSGIGHPQGIVVADFNGDGKSDIAVSNFDTNTIAVFLNDGLGNFAAPIVTTVQLTSSLGLNVGSLAVGDFNEDGKADLVVATIAGSQVSIVLLGNGDGTFRQQPPIPNSFGFLRAKIVDLNGDGHQDLVFAMDGSLGVSLGKGDGTFGAMTGLPSGSFPGLYLGLTVADFNGDGKLDIVASDFGSAFGGFGTLVFYAGNGDGTFVNPTAVTLSTASFPGSLASGDFNSDGKQDVLIGFPNAALISFGNGDGTFNLAQNGLEFVYSGTSQTPTTNSVTAFATALTKDGRVDAVTSDFDTGTLQIALNGALGQVPPNPGIFSFAFAPGLADIAAGDLNGDGVLDVVVINNQTSEVDIVLSK